MDIWRVFAREEGMLGVFSRNFLGSVNKTSWVDTLQEDSGVDVRENLYLAFCSLHTKAKTEW